MDNSWESPRLFPFSFSLSIIFVCLFFFLPKAHAPNNVPLLDVVYVFLHDSNTERLKLNFFFFKDKEERSKFVKDI